MSVKNSNVRIEKQEDGSEIIIEPVVYGAVEGSYEMSEEERSEQIAEECHRENWDRYFEDDPDLVEQMPERLEREEEPEEDEDVSDEE